MPSPIDSGPIAATRPINLGSSLQITAQGRIATYPQDEYVRKQIEMILFTNPGERPNRPTFGSGLMNFVFAPNSVELAATLQVSLHATLEKELRNLASVEDLEVTNEDSQLIIVVAYIVLSTGSRRTDVFERRF
ncbi:MAG: GPW/gp25 family protein [Schlesneria sp.]